MTESNNNSSRPPKKNNNRRRRKNSTPKKANAAGTSTPRPAGNRNNANKNRRPKSLTPAKINQKYDNLMDLYITARKKYFEMYARATGKQLDKIERNYASSLKALRDFETKLGDWQKEVLQKKINGFKEDREYSGNHDLTPEGDQVSFVGEFEDPHLLPVQKSSDWASDTEESSGSMEDYEQYKSSSI